MSFLLLKLVKLQATISNSQEDFVFRISTRQSLWQLHEHFPRGWLTQRYKYNTHLINLVFLVRTIKIIILVFPVDLWPARDKSAGKKLGPQFYSTDLELGLQEVFTEVVKGQEAMTGSEQTPIPFTAFLQTDIFKTTFSAKNKGSFGSVPLWQVCFFWLVIGLPRDRAPDQEVNSEGWSYWWAPGKGHKRIAYYMKLLVKLRNRRERKRKHFQGSFHT